MKTIYNAIEGFTETKNVFANTTILVVVSFIIITLFSVIVKISTNPNIITFGNW